MPEPVDRSLQTRASLAEGLARLGVRPGETLLVHSSLSALGWVAGGPVAAALALLDALGTDGTLVVPTQTGANSDPSGWSRPPVPEEWWQPYRDHAPGYDPARTPTRGMGAIPELVRTWPGAVRSPHPVTSFAALGPAAADLMAVHDLECELGERSPLANLEAADARVLLLGAGFDACTAFHLAEYRVPGLPRRVRGCAVLDASGERRWVTYDDVDLDSEDFADLGADFAATPHVVSGTVGDATCHLFPVRAAVAYATGWLAAHRLPAPS